MAESLQKNEKLSVSDIYLRKSNRMILSAGIIMLLLFICGLLYLWEISKGKDDIKGVGLGDDPNNTIFDPDEPPERPDRPFPINSGKTDALDVTPTSVDMTNVFVGTKATATVSLIVKSGRVVNVASMDFSGINKIEGVKVEPSCASPGVIGYNGGDTCNIDISWEPKKIENANGTMLIKWSEEVSDSTISQVEQNVTVNVRFSSIDRNMSECGVCKAAPEVAEPKKLAVSFSEKVLGLVDFEGKLVDEKSVVLGRMLSDGTILSLNSDIIGIAVNLGGVIDDNGNFVGTINRDGSVIDKGGNAVGRITSSYSVKDSSGKIIGYPVPRGFVIDGNNVIIGEVVDDGKVLSSQAVEIGRVRKDGVVYDKTGKKIIGHIVPQGIAMSPGCHTIGVVTPNGLVVDGFNRNVGRITQNGTVIDRNGNIIASLIRGGIVVDFAGKLIGTMSVDGSAMNMQGYSLGCVLPNGLIADENNKILGGTVPSGPTVSISPACSLQGYISNDGRVLNNNKEIGRINYSGDVIDANKSKIGYASYKRRHGLHVNLGSKDDIMYGSYFSPPQPIVYNKDNNEKIVFSGDTASVKTQGINACLDVDGSLKEKDEKIVGFVPYKGNIIGKNLKIVGSVSYNGKAVDKKGLPLGNVVIDGTVVNKNDTGFSYVGDVAYEASVVDTSGKVLGYSFINGRVYDNEGNEIGRVLPGGNVIDKDGVIIGNAVKNGVVVNNAGKLFGHTGINGLVENQKREEAGRILADNTVISKTGKILGRFYDKNTMAVINIENGSDSEELVQAINGDGSIKAKNTIAYLRADGSLVSKDGEFNGSVLPSGMVYDNSGNFIGTVSNDGSVYNSKKQLLGVVFANSAVLNGTYELIGMVKDHNSLFIDNRGNYSGYSVKGNAVFDAKGKEIGVSLTNGTVVNFDGVIMGRLVRAGVVIDRKGNGFGFVSNDGKVVNFKDENIGFILPNGLAVNNDGVYIGSIVPYGTAVNVNGDFLGKVSPDGEVVDSRGYRMGRVLPNRRVVNNQGEIIGGVIQQGTVVNDYAKVIGVTNSEGKVTTVVKGNDIGKVLFGGIVINEQTGTFLGRVIPFGSIAIDNYGDVIGFVNYKGKVESKDGNSYDINARGFVLDDKSRVIGSLLSDGIAVDSYGDMVGYVMPDASVVDFKEHLLLGNVVAGGMVVDKQRRPIARVVEDGIAVDSFAKVIGFADKDGSIINSSFEKIGVSSLGKIVLSVSNKTPMAKLVKEEMVISEVGDYVGRVSSNGFVLDGKGIKVGRVLADSLVVSEEGNLKGGVVKSGVVYDNKGGYLGVVGFDGNIYRKDKTISYKSLPDGTVVSGNQKDKYTIFGYVTDIGIPVTEDNSVPGYISLDGSVIGRMTVAGRVYNNNYMFDKNEVIGVVSPIETVVGNGVAAGKGCMVTGVSSYDGSVINNQNEKIGKLTPGMLAIDRSNAVIGGIRMEGVVINNSCKLIGYSGPDGRAMDKNFHLLGCVNGDGKVLDKDSNEVGFVYPRGTVVSLDGSQEMGRTSFDGHAIDKFGTKFGCVKSDYYVSAENSKLGKVYRHRMFNDSRRKYAKTAGGSNISLNSKLSVGADGSVMDSNGKTLLDSKGRPLTVDKDGYLIDSDGNRILGPDGKPLRVGKDGSLIDSNGNPVDVSFLKNMKVDSNGMVVDEDGNPVLGPDGKPVRVDADGNLIDANGNYILGPDGKPLRVDENGNIVDSNGNIITGKLFKKMRLGPDGKTIVDEYGNPVLGPDGKPLMVDAEGYVVDSNGNRILDKYGKPIRVNAEGYVVDSKGELLKVGLDGRIVDSNGNTIMPPGKKEYPRMRLGPDGKTIVDEYVNPVLGPDGKPLTVDAEGYVVDSNGNRILDKYGKPIKINADGYVVDSNGEILTVGPDGKISHGKNRKIALDLNGNPISGTVTADGKLIDANGNEIGHVINDEIFDNDGNKMGVLQDAARGRDVSISSGGVGGFGGYNLPRLKSGFTGPRELYNKKDLEAILQKQQQRREGMKTKRVTSKKYKKKVYRDWSHASKKYKKIVSSKPINMDRLIMKGKAIPAVLVSAINSSMTDNPVLAVVDRNVYGETGREILLPAGSKLVGKVNGGASNQGWVSRIGIVWERVVRPDGVMFDLEGNAHSGDSHGRGGVIGYTDQEIFKRYVMPALGAIGEAGILYSLAGLVDASIQTDSDGHQMKSTKSEAQLDAVESLRDNLGSIWQRMMNEAAQFKLVTLVPSGTRITVYASDDMFIRTPEDDAALEEEEANAEAEKAGRNGGNDQEGQGNGKQKGGRSRSKPVKTGGGNDNPGAYQGVIQDNPRENKNPNPNNRGQASYYQGAPGVQNNKGNIGAATGQNNNQQGRTPSNQTGNAGGQNGGSGSGNLNPPTPYRGGDYPGVTPSTGQQGTGVTVNKGGNSSGVVESESEPRLF